MWLSSFDFQSTVVLAFRYNLSQLSARSYQWKDFRYNPASFQQTIFEAADEIKNLFFDQQFTWIIYTHKSAIIVSKKISKDFLKYIPKCLHLYNLMIMIWNYKNLLVKAMLMQLLIFVAWSQNHNIAFRFQKRDIQIFYWKVGSKLKSQLSLFFSVMDFLLFIAFSGQSLIGIFHYPENDPSNHSTFATL